MDYTERQLSEKNHYDKFYSLFRKEYTEKVNLDVVDRSAEKPYNAYWKIYDLLKNNDLSGKRILDCGCGAGEHSIRLAALGLNVYGVDISKMAIECARQRARNHGVEEQIIFSLNTLEKMPFDDKYFDFVFGIDVLHHVNIERAIPEIKRVLKDGGKGFFKEWKEFKLFDVVRNSKIGLMLVPKTNHMNGDPFFDNTPMEKKLTSNDILYIRNNFYHSDLYHFYILGRLSRVLQKTAVKEKLLMLDYRMMNILPFINRLAGEVIIVLYK